VTPFTAQTVKEALNFYIRKETLDIYVSHVDSVTSDFHARHSCLTRSYVYKISAGIDQSGYPFDQEGRWFVTKPLDLEKMKEACTCFEGAHDFASFCTPSGKPTQRDVDSLFMTFEKPDLPFGPCEQIFINIHAVAKAFLHHQVRKMVATIVAVGLGKMTIEKLKEIMEAKDPNRGPKMAPAVGLYFNKPTWVDHVVLDSSAVNQETLISALSKKKPLEITSQGEEQKQQPKRKKQKMEDK